MQRARPSARQLQARQVSLEVKDLRAEGLHGVSFQLHEGELLGLGGLKRPGPVPVVARALRRHAHIRARVTVDGAPYSFNHPRQAMRRGLALVPGERAREGLLLIRSILENLLIPSWRSTASRCEWAKRGGREHHGRFSA